MGRGALLGIALLLLGVSSARAEPIVLVNPDPVLLEATEKALSPWQLDVEAIATKLPPSESMPGARDTASALSEEHSARAVVWLTRNAAGEALWIYDREIDRVIVRKVGVSLPLNDAEAAAVALSIKTLLMHSTAAPPEERFGASATVETPNQTPKAPEERNWLLLSGVALRLGGEDNGSSEARLQLAMLRRYGRSHVGLGLSTGSGRVVESEGLQGHFSDWSFRAQAQQARSWKKFWWVAGASLGLHWTSLSGSLSASGVAVKVSRLNPSLGLSLGVEREFGPTRLGVSAGGLFYSRTQRYLVDGDPVLDLPTFESELSIYLALPL